jgi:hypothetical protein
MPDNMARMHGIRAHVVCNKEGKVHLTQDAQLLPDTPRGALTTAATVTDSDKSGEVSILRNPEDRVAFVYTSGLVFSAAFSADERGEQMPNVEPYCSTAPGLIPSEEGQGTVDLDRQVITSQNHSNQIAGRVYAQVNNTYPELRVKMRDYLDYLDIHLAEFWEIDIATGDTIREIALTDQKLIPRQVDARVSGGAIQVDAVFEPEMESEDGVAATYCFDELPALPGIPELPIDGPGAIVTAGSVYYKAPTGDSWTLRTAEATSDIIQDPFWRTRQSTTNSSSAILVRGGAGFIKRSTNGGTSWSTVTPSNPPNDAGDSPAPTAANLDFKILDASYATQGEFIAVATWTASGGEKRSWLYFTDDDWATDSAAALTPDDQLSWGSGVDVSDTPPDDKIFMGRRGQKSTYENSVEVGPGTYVYQWSDKSNAIDKIRAFNTAGSYGAEVDYIHSTDLNGEFTICSLNPASYTFLIGYMAFNGTFLDYWLRVGTITGLTISLGTAYRVGTYQGNQSITQWSFHVERLSNTTALVCLRSNISGSDTDAMVVTISGTTISSIGSPVDYQSGAGDPVLQCFSVALSSTRAIIVWRRSWFDDPDFRSELKAVEASISGETITLGASDYVLAADNDEQPGYAYGQALSSTKFILTFIRETPQVVKTLVGEVDISDVITKGSEVTIHSDPRNNYPPTIAVVNSSKVAIAYDVSSVFGLYVRYIDISGLTPTVDTATYFHEDDDILPHIHYAGSNFVVVYEADDTVGGTWDYARFATVSIGAGGEFDALGAVIGRGSGAKAWVTGSDDSSLQLLEVALPGFGTLAYDLGSATIAQVDARTYYAIPGASFGSDDILYVAGRMNAPQGLSNPSHIIYSATGGLAWSETEASWGADHCGAIYEAPDLTLFAVLNRTNQCKLYVGSAVGVSLRSTSSLNDGVDFHGLTVSADAVALLAGKSADSILVVGSMAPYYVWTDLTADHGTASGINAIEIL